MALASCIALSVSATASDDPVATLNIPGWVRLDVPEAPESPLVAAFRNEDGREVAVVLIHPGKVTSKFDVRVMGADADSLDRVYGTDRTRRCERFEWSQSLTPESVTTLLYLSEAVRVSGESERR
jgi:hypothetical protein